ncbi:hypothetical protein MVLG_00394 [Microbotryum lychnidis-dioicae p1A1 Lamole]|uniref:Membrane permease n=1 Tax=Microbotryum lychnidis-dioicae (strain p1A1 Lamole / MvSl-1064) TaxID=683840 RepID=U5GYY5_USTV1|nr:hypothetical protein MVLG_00394 [Microbotryum lychnidis-dioicae p1A1 Lamole]|eukprot:KDE09494.1 hypothetical protein MVLG_00394 [Microbotryum lychnidis-dioicae p1A1 Lamole]
MPSANRWNENLPVKLVNVAVFIFLFGTGLYGAMSPAGHGGKETYFTPSSYVFYTWSIIDVLLLGYVIYQFFDSSADAVNGIGWRFAIVAILNAIFTHVYVTHHYIVAFIFSLFVASSVSTIYYSLAAHYPSQGTLDAVFVQLPFSLWHAWSIVTIFISGFAAFTHGGHGHHPSVTVKVLVVLSSAFLASTAVAYSFKSRRGDVAGAAVLAWTLFGIYDHQHGTGLIRYFALGSFIVSLLAILKSLYFTFIANDGQIALGDNERAPLVG